MRVLCALLLSASAALSAAPVYKASDTIDGESVTPYTEILVDPGGARRFSDIRDKEFSNPRLDSLNFGFSEDPVWLKFTLKNTTGSDLVLIYEVPYHLLDYLEFYEPSPDGDHYRVTETGDRRPFDSRSIRHRHFLFPIELPPGATRTYFLRAETLGSLNLENRLWSVNELNRTTSRDQIILGIYYGILIVSMLFNLFMFFSFRDRTYLYYSYFMLTLGILMLILNGLAYQHFWPESPGFEQNIFLLIAYLTTGSALLFSAKFLNLRNLHPHLNRFFLLFIALLHLLAVMSLSVPYRYMVILQMSLSAAGFALMIVTAVFVYVRGLKSAVYYLLGWAVLFTGILAYQLASAGIITSSIISTWGVQLASALEIIILTFGLADRVRNINRRLADLTADLENRVSERTSELNRVLGNLREKDSILQRELQIASNIQQSILPPEEVQLDRVSVTAYYRSMHKIGGDFYDIIQMPGGETGVLIADVSGHGVPAALVTAMIKISFQTAALNTSSPSDIFKVVNYDLLNTMTNLSRQEFLTAFMIVIDHNLKARFASASHQRMIYYSAESQAVQVVNTNGFFIGFTYEAADSYTEAEIQLHPGDRMLLYTDGISETRDYQNIQFGEQRLVELFSSTLDKTSTEVRDIIESSLQKHAGSHLLHDDMCFLLIDIV